MLKVKCFVCNTFCENSYVVYDSNTKECAIIDAGFYYADEEDAVTDFIEREKLKVKYLLNTHLHLDHCFGATYIANKYGVGLSADNEDIMLLNLIPQQCEMFGIKLNAPVPELKNIIKEGDIIKIGNYPLIAISVPGHSPGSLCYYCKEEGILFSGDVLFKESIGRTDLYGGSYKALNENITSKIFTLPDNTIVYCGHGPTTTIEYEKEYNPYL
ncbi:MAG: MBL fold metallo-hydrolase [Bacteroidales bacterium]|nr:MBL fold metallo-hydrolase [Bacteroidales bacterium]